tara:strand:- start:1070 stop:2422 length:1353 start_codon:yes stop_codon:yes gene_type:complete
MKTYKSLLKEAKAKSAVMVFGRFNPPTIGHGKLLESAGNVARRFNAELYVYGSQSQDPKKNPLSNQQKMNFMKEMFPKYKNSIQADPNIRSAIDAAVKLNEGNDQLVMVVGSDRVADFKKLLEQYNGRKAKHGYYEYDSIKIVSAGERDPDAEGVTGMSASKMRKAASENDVDSFRNGVPSNMSEQSMMRMLKSVRKGLNLKEAIFDKEWPTRPEKITLEVPEEDLEYNYMGYETEYFSHMPIVEETFSELRSLSLSKTKHNVSIVEAMKETDKLIENMCLFELGHSGLENKIETSVRKIDKLFEGIEKDFGASKGDLFYRPFLYHILESITWGPHPGQMNVEDKIGPVEWGTPKMVERYAKATPGQNSDKLLYSTYKYKMQREVTGEADGFGTVELAQEEGPVSKVKKEYAKKYKDLISDRKRDVGGARMDHANKNLKSAQTYSSSGMK